MFTFNAVTSLYERLASEPEFPHLSRVLDLPPLVAQAALDAVRCDHTRPAQTQRWDVSVSSGCLKLVGQGWVSPPPRVCYWPYREIPGTIHIAAQPVPLPVRLELVPWSRTHTALGLGVRRIPVFAGNTGYLDAAFQALELLTNELTAWGLHEVDEMEQWLRSQGTQEEAA